MKIPFLSATATALDYRKPEPSAIPSLDGLQVGAAYCIARMGGDYFEFLSPSPTRLVFALFDISGQRNQSLEIAAHVQDVLRARAPELFANDDINETEAIAALALEVNRVVLRAADGPRNSPAFLGSFNRSLGILSYINAGHPAGLIKDGAGITRLASTGIPLGLFSHSTFEPQVSVVEPGAALLLSSRGLVETRCKGEEFGEERLMQAFRVVQFDTAQDLCTRILDAAKEFCCGPLLHNDVTTIALVRHS